MKVIFDVDGTLITWNDEPNLPVVAMLKALHLDGWQVFVASGGGQQYAQDWCAELGLSGMVTVIEKGENPEMLAQGFDLCVDDDQDCRFAPLTLQVFGGKGKEPWLPKKRLLASMERAGTNE